MSPSHPRIVLVTNGNYFARLLVDRLLGTRADDIAGVLVVTGDYKKRSKLRSLFAHCLCTAWPYIGYKAFVHAAMLTAGRIRGMPPLGVAEAAEKIGIPVRTDRTVNSAPSREWVASLQPDILVSVSCPQLIGKKMLAIPRVASLNVHSSLLPQYAGLAPYFWVLSSAETATGISVHYMTERFDEGNILKQAHVTIAPSESAFSLFRRLAIIGGPLLDEAVDLAFRGSPGTPQEMSLYSYFSHPTLSGYIALRRNGYRLVRLRELAETFQSERLNRRPVR